VRLRTAGDGGRRGFDEILRTQPNSNGQVGVIGFDPAGRPSTIWPTEGIRGSTPRWNCWGGSVIVKDKKQSMPSVRSRRLIDRQ